MSNQLNIFIDESGDFGFGKGHAKYYIISFVLHDINNSISEALKEFNLKLTKLDHIGMVHLGDLIHGNNSYKNWSIKERKSVMWNTIFFANKCDILYHSIIIDRCFINNSLQLNQTIARQIKSFIDTRKAIFSKYNSIKIYYDNGQKSLAAIIDTCFIDYPVERVSDFNKNEKRLFQVADMLSYVDKILYKYNHKIRFTKTEEKFFSKPNISIKKTVKHIRSKLKKNRA